MTAPSRDLTDFADEVIADANLFEVLFAIHNWLASAEAISIAGGPKRLPDIAQGLYKFSAKTYRLQLVQEYVKNLQSGEYRLENLRERSFEARFVVQQISYVIGIAAYMAKLEDLTPPPYTQEL